MQHIWLDILARNSEYPKETIIIPLSTIIITLFIQTIIMIRKRIWILAPAIVITLYCLLTRDIITTLTIAVITSGIGIMFSNAGRIQVK